MADEVTPKRGKRSADTPQAEISAVDRLRAFEDENFGKDAVRFDERIERGSGSPFQQTSPEIRRQHAAHERLVEAEQQLATANAAVITANANYVAALAEIEPKPDAVE